MLSGWGEDREGFSKAVISNFRLTVRSGPGLERTELWSEGRACAQVQE